MTLNVDDVITGLGPGRPSVGLSPSKTESPMAVAPGTPPDRWDAVFLGCSTAFPQGSLVGSDPRGGWQVRAHADAPRCRIEACREGGCSCHGRKLRIGIAQRPTMQFVAIKTEALDELDDKIYGLDTKLRTGAREDEETARLMAVPGIGPITALAVQALAPPMESFRCGRDFSAWLGLVPRQHTTVGKLRLRRISKMGQRDLQAALDYGRHRGHPARRDDGPASSRKGVYEFMPGRIKP